VVTVADLERVLAGRVAEPRWSLSGRIPGAVLIPVLERGEGLEILAIKRPDGLRHHSREIAFPGGKPEDVDASLLETALRETEEELGIDRSRLRFLGMLTPVPTATSSFALHPFVASLEPGPDLRPAPEEVAALIRMSLPAFFAGAIPYRAFDLGHRLSPIFDFEPGSMYGATAHILQELLELYADLAGLEMPVPTVTADIPWA
jgi:8-oxo-dGTP pyrophosphatase MutT (NUDIX family)